jgi:flagellar biogenesis protein FliO
MRLPRTAYVGLFGLLAAAAWAAEPAALPPDESTSAPAPPATEPSAGSHAGAGRGTGVVKRPPAALPATARSEPASRGLAWLRTTASLAGVVALIVLLAWGYRLMTGAGGRLPRGLRARQPGLIELLGRTNLTPRQSLYLVRVGPELVLIGATNETLRALSIIRDADWAARLAGQHAAGQANSHLAEFRHCLAAEVDTYGERDGDAARPPQAAPAGAPESTPGGARAAADG